VELSLVERFHGDGELERAVTPSVHERSKASMSDPQQRSAADASSTETHRHVTEPRDHPPPRPKSYDQRFALTPSFLIVDNAGKSGRVRSSFWRPCKQNMASPRYGAFLLLV
jgi:hypothetical protein